MAFAASRHVSCGVREWYPSGIGRTAGMAASFISSDMSLEHLVRLNWRRLGAGRKPEVLKLVVTPIPQSSQSRVLLKQRHSRILHGLVAVCGVPQIPVTFSMLHPMARVSR